MSLPNFCEKKNYEIILQNIFCILAKVPPAKIQRMFRKLEEGELLFHCIQRQK